MESWYDDGTDGSFLKSAQGLRGDCSGAEEAEMKLPAVETFLTGVAFGIGLTLLSLYTQKPSCLVATADTIVERGRARKDKREQDKFLRRRLRTMGFSSKEISENL
jgi:hypothetical protein